MRTTPARSHLEHGPTIVTARVPGEAAAVYLRLAAGSADEHEGEHGAAHFLEHMLFKGSDRHGIGDAAAQIEGFGGDLNAWTSHDELVLHADVSAGAWRLVLDVLTDMLRTPRMDPDELERERQVILEEIASYEDDPDEALAEAVQAHLWGAHPYARPVIGTVESVRGLDLATVRAFLQRELTADRITLVVVGDVMHEEVVEAAAEAFASWPSGPGRRPVLPPTRPEQAVVARPPATFDDRAVELAWPGPPLGHPDVAALQVLGSILGPAAGDRITEILDEEPKVGFDGWCETSTGLHGSSISIGFRPLPGHTAEALARVTDLIGRFTRGCRGRLAARARETVLADLDFAEQTVDGIAEDLLVHETLYGDAAHRAAWREAIAAVTPAHVARAARRWLTTEPVVGILDPSTTDATVHRALRREVPERRGVRTEGPRVHRIGGSTVVIAPSDVPVAAARVVVPGGSLLTSDRLAGLGVAWARTIHRGAGRLDGEALHDALDDLAAELSPVEGYQSSALSVTAPGSHAADALELLGELVLEPHFADEEWALVREELLDGVRSRLDRPREVVADEAAALRFPGHPWRLPTGGTEASLQRIDGKAMLRFHERQFRAGRVVVAVAGGVSEDEALEALSWLEDLPEPSHELPAHPWPALVPGRHVVHAGTRQATLALIGDGVGLEQVDRRGLELAEALLEGQSGRLFLDLREVRGLAYDLWARNDERAGGGVFHLGLACDPSRVDEAADAMRAVLERLASEPPAEAELARARAMLHGREVLRAQRVEHHASRLAYGTLFGLDLSPGHHAELLAATSAEQVSAEVRRMLDRGLLEIRSVPRSDR